jgi:hypothetical protein
MQLTKMKPNSTFYASKNYFKYIRPGAIRIGSSSDNVDILETAFYHPVNKTYTIVMINKSSVGIPVNLKGSNIPVQYQAFRTSQFMNFEAVDSVKDEIFLLPPNSITTLYANRNSALTMDALQDIYLGANAPQQTIHISGISNGSNGVDGLSLSVSTDNTELLPDLDVGSIASDGTATLTFTPAADMTGTAKVTLVLSDEENLPRIVTFYVIIEATGIEETKANALRAYPNPADDYLIIDVPESGYQTLIVTDIVGRTMEQLSISDLSVVLNVRQYKDGVYIIKLMGKDNALVTQFVKY